MSESKKASTAKRELDVAKLVDEIMDGKVSLETIEETLKARKFVASEVATKPIEATDEKEVVKPPFEFSGSSFMELGDCFIVQKAVHAVLTRNVKSGTNTMLLGPTGVGKTELVANIARDMDLPLTIFDMGTMTDPIMSMVGTHAIEVKDGITHSSFKRSRFSEVIQKPGIVLLDEISRASAAANNLLFPCLDFRKELAMEYDFTDSTPVKIHPECVFIATANLGSQYTGTHKLDRALVDRFMVIEIDPLSNDNIKKIVTHNFPKLKREQVNKIVKCYANINQSHDEFKISFNLSIRHLKLVCELVTDGFTIYDSFYMICKGVGNKEGVNAVEAILADTKSKS